MPDHAPIFIPLGDMAPDQAHITMAGQPPHVLAALSVWPHGAEGYIAAQDLQSAGVPVTLGRPTGSCLYDKNWLYFGTDTGLLVEIDVANSTQTTRYTAATSGYLTVEAFRYDDSATPPNDYTSIKTEVNGAGAPAANPFPAGAAAVEDAVYLGYSVPQTSLVFTLSEAGTGAYTVAWEYSTVAGWSALSGLADATNGFRPIHSWREDNDAGPSFTDVTTDVNDPGGPDALPFPSGAAAVNDAWYYGSEVELTSISVNVGTAGTHNYTVVWEYYNGAWVALSGVTDNTTGFTVGGTNSVTWTAPTDWTETSIGGVSKFWVRARISVFTSSGTDPVLTQVTPSPTQYTVSFTQPLDHTPEDVDGTVAYWYRCRISAFSTMPYDPEIQFVQGNFAHDRDWSLIRFGDNIIASNEYDPVQVQTARGQAFSDLITTTDKPQARHLSHYKGRLVLGWIRVVNASDSIGARGTYPYSIWMSGIQAANNFDPTDLTALSVFQTLPTKYGEMTGLAEVGDQILPFFERAVYRVSDSGLVSASLTFFPVAGAQGTTQRRSIVTNALPGRQADAAMYWSLSGPAAVTPTGYYELGADKLTTALLKENWPLPVQIALDATTDTPDIIGTLVTRSNSMVWRYPAAESSWQEALLVWNIRTGRFSVIPILGDRSARLLEDRSDADGETWEPGSNLILGMWDGTDTELQQFSTTTQAGDAVGSGTTTAMRFILSYLEIMAEEVTQPQGFQVIASPINGSSGLPTISVTIRAKRDPAEVPAADQTVTVSTSDIAVTSGWLPLMGQVGGNTVSAARGRYHQLDVTVTPTATWGMAEIQGFRLLYTMSGEK